MLRRALPLCILQYRRDRLLGQRVGVHRVLSPARPPPPERWPGCSIVSSRTLHRQLHEEGTSLQVLKNEVRHEMAVDLLRRTTRPVKQVALAVGFRNEKSFSRAFLQWIGACASRLSAAGAAEGVWGTFGVRANGTGYSPPGMTRQLGCAINASASAID